MDPDLITSGQPIDEDPSFDAWWLQQKEEEKPLTPPKEEEEKEEEEEEEPDKSAEAEYDDMFQKIWDEPKKDFSTVEKAAYVTVWPEDEDSNYIPDGQGEYVAMLEREEKKKKLNDKKE